MGGGVCRLVLSLTNFWSGYMIFCQSDNQYTPACVILTCFWKLFHFFFFGRISNPMYICLYACKLIYYFYFLIAASSTEINRTFSGDYLNSNLSSSDSAGDEENGEEPHLEMKLQCT